MITRHNEVAGEIVHLNQKTLTPSAVRDEPYINSCVKELQDANETDEIISTDNDRGDILIRGFWSRGTHCVVDVRVTDTDSKAYQTRDPMKVLASQEKAKKNQYLEPCLHHRRHFTPFVVSTDGLMGREANYVTKRLAAILAERWNRPYSQVCGFVKARLNIAIVRATHLCIRGSRIPASKISRHIPLWEDGSGLSLFNHK